MKRIACIRWKSDDCKLQIEDCKLQILKALPAFQSDRRRGADGQREHPAGHYRPGPFVRRRSGVWPRRSSAISAGLGWRSAWRWPTRSGRPGRRRRYAVEGREETKSAERRQETRSEMLIAHLSSLILVIPVSLSPPSSSLPAKPRRFWLPCRWRPCGCRRKRCGCWTNWD